MVPPLTSTDISTTSIVLSQRLGLASDGPSHGGFLHAPAAAQVIDDPAKERTGEPSVAVEPLQRARNYCDQRQRDRHEKRHEPRDIPRRGRTAVEVQPWQVVVLPAHDE